MLQRALETQYKYDGVTLTGATKTPRSSFGLVHDEMSTSCARVQGCVVVLAGEEVICAQFTLAT
jgi:hypothetical protein